MATAAPQPSCCYTTPDLTVKHSSFSLFVSFLLFSSCCCSLVSFHMFQLILHLSLCLLCTSTSLFLLCFPFSAPPRLGITTRLSRGPWTCQSFGGSCKRRTQLTTPPQRRWCQTSASCSGTVRSSIMYVLPVFPLLYFPVTPRLMPGWGLSGLVLSCHKDMGTF